MPYTDEFIKLRRNYRSKYNDIARADTFAYIKALKEKIPTWKDRDKKIKRTKTNEDFYF